MTHVEVRSIKPQKKPHAIFISAGDRETFATWALDSLADTFDILIFQYGTSDAKRERFLKDGTLFAVGSGTKFNALKEIFRQHRDLLLRYETILVSDDDLVLETGDFRILPSAALVLGVAVLSPAHSIKGKIIHTIMLPVPGKHFLRYTSFVEMGCPLFQTGALARFLDAYDGSLSGCGDDWWFLNVLEANKRAVAAIVDTVTVINPYEHQKPGGYREIELLGKMSLLLNIWLAAKRIHGLQEWPMQNICYVRSDVAGLSALGHEAELFRRKIGTSARIFLAKLNYQIRFYKQRGQLNRWAAKLLRWNAAGSGGRS